MKLEELKMKSQWVNWNKKDINGKFSKIPCSYNGGPTGTNEKYKDTWTTYENAYKTRNDGIGLIFTNGICGIDIDDKDINSQEVKDIIELMDSYTEISPSGNGIHILFTCDTSKIPQYKDQGGKVKLDDKYYQKNPHNHMECYIDGFTNRYFTFTENRINKNDICERTEELSIFLNKYMLRKNTKFTITKDIDEVLEIINNSKDKEKFKKLYYDGNIEDYNSDDSSADLSLCNMLAYYTNGNKSQIDEIFRNGALYRDKWERNDYRELTISKAIGNCKNKFINNSSKKYLDFTIESLKKYLNEKNISIKFNEIRKDVEISGEYKNIKGYNLKDILPALINSDLKSKYKFCDMTTIHKYLNVIAIENSFNPVINKLEETIWDGGNHFQKLVEILGIQDDRLSCLLVYKWLWQSYSLLYNNMNNSFGADGILVLQGKQGIGKTSFVKKIAFDGEFCNIGKSFNQYDKDTKRWCCSNWIVELGEIETSLKNNIEQIKAFITDEKDLYRLPYAPNDSYKVRMTSLIGTCNSSDYLVDETGNRRFWTVILKNINLEELMKFDVSQLWAQIKYETKDNLQGFRLTLEENRLLEERNRRHEKKLPGEDEIIDLLSYGKDIIEFKEITVSEFKECYNVLRPYSVQQISKVLNKHGNHIKSYNNKKLRLLPVPKKRNLINDMIKFD